MRILQQWDYFGRCNQRFYSGNWAQIALGQYIALSIKPWPHLNISSAIVNYQETSSTALRSPWYFITCIAHSSRPSSRGTQTRSCFSRPTRNSWASSRRGDGPRSLSSIASRLFCSHTIDLPNTNHGTVVIIIIIIIIIRATSIPRRGFSRRAAEFAVCRRICWLSQKNAELLVFATFTPNFWTPL